METPHKFKRGDIIMYKNTKYAILRATGRLKNNTSGGLWKNIYYLCPLNKKGKPDKRSFNASFPSNTYLWDIWEEHLTLVEAAPENHEKV